jgi:hypothetical protein
VLGLLRQLHPRGMVFGGCAILVLAGMALLLAWLGTLPPREQLRRVDGQLQALTLQDAKTGTFEITLVSEGALHTFALEHAQRLVGLLQSPDLRHGIPVSVQYFEIGRNRRVVDVVLGQDRVVSYDEVARLAEAKAQRDRNSAIGFGALGAFLLLLGAAARFARSGPEPAAQPDPDTTIGALCWLALYGTMLVVMLTEPAILHRAFGTEVFQLPIEYVLPAALAVLLLPLWPGCKGLAALVRQAMRKGKGGRIGMLLELQSALRSSNPAERRMAIKALWFLGYLVALMAAWIAYAAMLGI